MTYFRNIWNSIQLGSGGAVGPGQSPGGVQEGEAPGSSESTVIYSATKESEITLAVDFHFSLLD